MPRKRDAAVATGLMLSPVLLAVGGCAAWMWLPATFTVRNETGQTITHLTVEIYGNEPHAFADIPPGGEVRGSFTVHHEASLELHGRLADGTQIDEWYGYVVWEQFAPHVGVVVWPDGSLGP